MIRLILKATFITSILAAGYFVGLGYHDYNTNGNSFVNVVNHGEDINFREHSLDEQIDWALCYINEHSNDMEEVRGDWSCPNEAFSNYFYRSVMSELLNSDARELIYCSQIPNIKQVIVIIGERMYINVDEGALFGTTNLSAIPIATIEVCTQLYDERSFPIINEHTI